MRGRDGEAIDSRTVTHSHAHTHTLAALMTTTTTRRGFPLFPFLVFCVSVPLNVKQQQRQQQQRRWWRRRKLFLAKESET